MFKVFGGCKNSKNVKDYESPRWFNDGVNSAFLCEYKTFEEAGKYAESWLNYKHIFILNEPHNYSGNFYVVIREVKI